MNSGRGPLKVLLPIKVCILLTAVFFISCEIGQHPIGPMSDDVADNQYIAMRALPSSIAADPAEQSIIEVTVYNYNHNPVVNKEVLFTSTMGIITAKDTTDENGIARAVLTAEQSEGIAVVTAMVVLEDTTVKSITSVHLTNTTSTIDSVNAFMHIRAVPDFIPADYNDSAQIEVRVYNEERNPVIGKEIMFTATKGLVPASAITDNNGIAQVTFKADTSSGNAVISARMLKGDSLMMVAVKVALITIVTADSINPRMRIRALPNSIAAEYDEHSEIEVTVYDDSHNPVIGKKVLFSATKGMVTGSAITNNKGIANAIFTGDPSGGEAIISARTSKDDSLIVVSTVVKLVGTTVQIDSVHRNMRIRAYPSHLLASYNETSTVEVAIFDDNHNPVQGKEIIFSSNAGTITGKGITDKNGIATTTFSSEPVNKDVTITASMAHADSSLSVSTTVTINGIAILLLPNLTKAPIGEIIPVTIRLLDGKGDPIPDQRIFISGNGDSVKTTNGAGEITTSVYKATEGQVILKASALGTSDSTIIYFGNTAPIDNNKTVRSIRLFTSHSQLRADNSAEATVTAIIISEDNHNPLIGDTVQFSSSLGIIDQFGVTDSTGRTSVTLRSAPVNGDCQIVGVVKSNASLKDSTSILFSGVTLELICDRNNLRINDTTVVTARLKDGSGNPISSDRVNFAVQSPGIFEGGKQLTQSNLTALGSAMVRVTSNTAGIIKVHSSSANITDSIELSFTTSNLTAKTSRSAITIGGKDSSLISVIYRDGSGNPLIGRTITFAANAGTLSATSAVTNGNGLAATYLRSGYFATEATVHAKSSDGSAFTTVTFTSSVPGSIALTITPDNIGINGGVAELIATVKDDSGNVVTGAEVSFKILKGPGGNEYVDKPIIVTTNAGIARAKLYSGSLPSSYRGCEIEAVVNSLSSTTKLTISGEPNTITISRPQDDTVVVPNAGYMDESTFEYNIGAVVKDVNGNPVADGTPVNFSAVVSGMAVYRRHFVRWETKNMDVNPIIDYSLLDIPFEDINGNFRFDHGIDLDLDDFPTVASRGDDRDGDGTLEYNFLTNGMFWDFNLNGICDTSSNVFTGEPYYGNLKLSPEGDLTADVYADLNLNGKWDRYECPPDRRASLPPEMFSVPYSYEFEFWRWETRPQFHNVRLNFRDNDFALVIDRTAITKDGVAYTKITYPRQLARRLFATVNAEVKGIRDRNGERFVLPVIVE